VPSVFRVLQEAGQVATDEMFRAFNMGIGMIVTCDTATAARIRDFAAQAGVDSCMLGHLRPGSGRVHLV
jgi:phosphoribosylformylglycinamidine cyclo-ligase